VQLQGAEAGEGREALKLQGCSGLEKYLGADI